MPHVGTMVPSGMASRMTQEAAALPDTDWNVDRLYDFLDDLGAHVIQANYSRYVIDLNRPPDGSSLYPGASNTGLCPLNTFDESPIYRRGEEPDAAEIDERRKVYWEPYHDHLAAVLKAVRDQFGVVLLWDAHSIRSRVPRFFEGRLPDLNIGSGDGASAARALLAAVVQACSSAPYDHVVDGRFKGGYITRYYGRPSEGIHALQLELSWATYMEEEPPFAFREDLAQEIRPVLKAMMTSALNWIEAQRR